MDGQGGGQAGVVPCHVGVCVAHVVFKVVAMFVYLFESWLSVSFVMVFIVCIVTLAMDFWIVKNVSGRKLVGLRWWNETTEEGASEWKFEALEEERQMALNPTDKKVFWYSMIAVPAIWAFLAVYAAITFEINYLLIAAVAVFMNGANGYGYFKCSKEAKQQVADMTRQAASAVATQAFRV